MKWTKLDGRYCYYTKNSDGYYISLNVLNGTTLLNGEPPGRLPSDVLNHTLYLKVFGKNHNFTIELEYDGTKKTIYPSKGRYYSFKSIQNHLLVFEEEPSKDMILKLRLLD